MSSIIRVLLIEDSESDVALISQYLSHGLDSVEVLSASSLANGRDALRAGELDIVLLDLTLPDSEGIETFLTIRQEVGTVPVVILSGVANESVAIDAVQRGAQDYIFKNRLDPDTLSRSVRFAIERSRLKHIESELNAARDVQQTLYPKVGPEISGFDIAGAVAPAEHACGDYFDFVKFPSAHLGAVVGDVSGHGMRAALVMVEARAYVRLLARETTDLLTLMTKLNSLLTERQADHFVTMFFSEIDSANRIFKYASAGQIAYLLREDGSHQVLEATGLPLGVLDTIDIQVSDPITLRDGDILFLPTDGIDETFSPNNQKFGEQRILDTIQRNSHKSSAEIIQSVIDATSRFRGGRVQSDDITAVAIKVLHPS